MLRIAVLAFFLAPAGCVMTPDGGHAGRDSLAHVLFGPESGTCGATCEASCGAPCDAPPADDCTTESQCGDCPPHKRWLHWPKLHFYEPEAGLFNFCVPPQCINPPAPLPPGRFFPVPVRPAFAQRGDVDYGLVDAYGAPAGSGQPSGATPCP